MHLKSLKTFCDVVRLGSFSKAAEANDVSQPNVSQLVHHLEERLGVRLVNTSKRPFVVTPEGKRYYEGCRDLVRRYEELEQHVCSLRSESTERVNVAAIYSVGLSEMHEIVGRFREEHTQVDLHVEYMHPDQVRSAVLSGEADLGVMSYAKGSKTLSVQPWREEPFAIAVAPNHSLASEVSIRPKRLQGETLVMPQEGLRVRQEIDRWLVAQRVRVHVAFEFDNLESVKRAIEVDEGIGLLPAPTFAAEVANGALARVDLTPIEGETERFVRPLGVISRRGESPSAATQDFVELLQQYGETTSSSVSAQHRVPRFTV